MADILLVDDMVGVRRAISGLLRRAGHTVTEAQDGQVAMEAIGQRRFDLLITDIMMPNVDGTELIIWSKARAPSMPVLAISGGGSQMPSDVTLMVAKLKADAALAKPFDNEDFIRVVDSLLEKAAKH